MRVIYARRCRVTGEKLAEALADTESTRVLNWGVGGSQTRRNWINSPHLVRAWGDKKAALDHMARQGVSVPQSLSLAYAKAVVSPDFPVVIRPSRGTRQGRGLYLCTTADQVQRHHDGIENPRITVFTDVISEFRVHIINGRSVKVQQKFQQAGRPNTGDPREDVIRTHRNGWVFEYPELSKPERKPLKDMAKKAVLALGYDIGAVDVGLDRHGNPVVFEVNAAAGLVNSGGADSPTFDKYVRHIKETWGD